MCICTCICICICICISLCICISIFLIFFEIQLLHLDKCHPVIWWTVSAMLGVRGNFPVHIILISGNRSKSTHCGIKSTFSGQNSSLKALILLVTSDKCLPDWYKLWSVSKMFLVFVRCVCSICVVCMQYLWDMYVVFVCRPLSK